MYTNYIMFIYRCVVYLKTENVVQKCIFFYLKKKKEKKRITGL